MYRLDKKCAGHNKILCHAKECMQLKMEAASGRGVTFKSTLYDLLLHCTFFFNTIRNEIWILKIRVSTHMYRCFRIKIQGKLNV